MTCNIATYFQSTDPGASFFSINFFLLHNINIVLADEGEIRYLRVTKCLRCNRNPTTYSLQSKLTAEVPPRRDAQPGLKMFQTNSCARVECVFVKRAIKKRKRQGKLDRDQHIQYSPYVKYICFRVLRFLKSLIKNAKPILVARLFSETNLGTFSPAFVLDYIFRPAACP